MVPNPANLSTTTIEKELFIGAILLLHYTILAAARASCCDSLLRSVIV